MRPSMGSLGDCYDNALCESFFATLECELIDRRRWRTQAEARMEVFAFIEGWYTCELLRGLLVESQANPRNRRCSAHDTGRSRIRFKRAAVSSTGWRASKTASTMSGARNASGIIRLTSP